MSKNILVVDDSIVERALLTGLLEKEYNVVELESGESCIESLKNDYQSVSAILLDIMMPSMDGFDVLRAIKNNSHWRPIPIIVITGIADESAQIRALSLGANAFITKPFNQELLLQMLRNTIELCETAALANVLRRDKLTGLYNREAFFVEARKIIDSHQPGSYVISCFNIEKFKVINDLYGVVRGDAVLKYLASSIDRCITRLDGITCHFSSDMFCALYPLKHQNAEEIARLYNTIATPPNLGKNIKVRIGLYVITDLSLTVSAMMDRAIMAQESIKGRYDKSIAEYSEAMRLAILHEQEIVGAMRSALEEGQFEPWFQPQYNHETGALIGSEALVRWRKPDGRLIPPNDFIPIFERSGFIYELDKNIWEQVCIILRKWIDAGRSVLPISVNISRYDVLHNDFTDAVMGLVKKYKLPIDLLRLEITESAFSDSPEQIVTTVKRLIEAGFTVEIDDFGSGYSSLNTLKDVPASILKLDMRFLENSGDSRRGGNILESTVRMARWLGMSVIAEGVETIEQADYLRSVGCFYIQGYLYSRPVPLREYEALTATGHGERELAGLTTVDNLDNNAFWDPDSMETLIFNSYVGGACIFEYHDGSAELLRINKRYSQEFGGKHLDCRPLFETGPAEHIDEANRKTLFDNIRRAIATGKESTCELRLTGISADPKQITYIISTMRMIANTRDHYLFYCVINNITSQRESERKERELSSRIAAIMDNANGGITATRLNGGVPEFVFSNDKYYEQLGYTREQFNAEITNAFQIIQADDREYAVSNVMEALKDKAPRSFEYRCTRRDGGIVHVRCSAAVTSIEGIDGDVLIAVMTDITELIMAKEIASRTSEQFQAIMDNISGGVSAFVLRDEKIEYLFANNQFYKLLGYTKDEYTSQYKGSFNMIYPEDREKFDYAIRQAIENNKPYSVEYRVIRADGSIGWLLSNVSIVRIAGFDIPVHLAVTNDFTELRSAQQQRFESAKKLEAVMRNINGGVTALTISPDDQIHYIFTNDQYYQLLGYTQRPDTAEESDHISHILPEDRSGAVAAVKEILQRHGSGSFTYRCLRKDGGVIYVQSNASACRIEGISDDVLITVDTDVTHEKESEEQLRFLNKAAHDILSQPDCETAIDDTLKSLLQFFAADRAYVVEMDHARHLSSNTYEVCADGISAEKDILQDVPYSDTESWIAPLKNNEYIMIESVSELKDIPLRELLLRQDINSLIIAPMFREGKLIGYVGVDNPALHANQMERLKALGDYIAILLTRRDLTAKIAKDGEDMLSLMNDTPGGFTLLHVSPEGQIDIRFYNDGMCHLLAMNRDQLKRVFGKNAMDGVHPDDREAVYAAIREMAGGKDVHDLRYRVRCGKSGYRWITSFGRRTVGSAGETLLNVYYADASERVNQEEAQKQLLENLPSSSAAFVYDGKSLRVVCINDNYWKLVERKRLAVEDVSIVNSVHPDDRDIILREIDSAISQNRDCTMNIRIRCGEEGYRPFHIVGRIVPNDTATYTIFLSFTPITDEELSIQSVLPVALSAVMAGSNDYTYVKDINLRYVACSLPVVRLLGLSSESEILGKTDYDLFDKGMADSYSASDRRIMASKSHEINSDDMITFAKGSTLHVSTMKSPLFDSKGNVIGILGSSKDMTAHDKASFELNNLLNVIPSGMIKYAADDDEEFAYVNKKLIENLGYTQEQFFDKFHNSFCEMVYPEDRASVKEEIARQKAGGDIGKLEYRVEAADGSLRWFHYEGVLITDKEQKSWHYATLVDITQQKAAEDRLRQSEDEYRYAISLGARVMCRYNIADSSLTFSPEAMRQHSLPERLEDVPYGRAKLGVISPDTADNYVAFFNDIRNGEKESKTTFKRLFPEGWRWLTAHSITVFDAAQRPVSAIILYADVTEIVETSERDESTTLNGVMNRGAFLDKLCEMIAKRRKGYLCALLMMDLDGFKQINDTLGHADGDNLLSKVGRILTSVIRENDHVCRMGGDGFLVALSNVRSRAAIEKKSKEICRLLHRTIGLNVTMSVSIGIVVCPDDGDDFNTLYRKVDIALHEAKKTDKDRYVFYNDDMTDNTQPLK